MKQIHPANPRRSSPAPKDRNAVRRSALEALVVERLEPFINSQTQDFLGEAEIAAYLPVVACLDNDSRIRDLGIEPRRLVQQGDRECDLGFDAGFEHGFAFALSLLPAIVLDPLDPNADAGPAVDAAREKLIEEILMRRCVSGRTNPA